MNIYGDRTFLIKNQSYQDENIQMEADFFASYNFSALRKWTEKRCKVNEKRFRKRLPSLLKLNAFRVLSYLFDYLQFFVQVFY